VESLRLAFQESAGELAYSDSGTSLVPYLGCKSGCTCQTRFRADAAAREKNIWRGRMVGIRSKPLQLPAPSQFQSQPLLRIRSGSGSRVLALLLLCELFRNTGCQEEGSVRVIASSNAPLLFFLSSFLRNQNYRSGFLTHYSFPPPSDGSEVATTDVAVGFPYNGPTSNHCPRVR